jgi:hypothetical protein
LLNPHLNDDHDVITGSITNEEQMNEYKKYFLNHLSEFVQNVTLIASSTKYICIHSIGIKIFRLGDIGAKFPGLEMFMKNKDIMAYTEDDNLCMFATLVYHKHQNEKLRTSRVRQEAQKYWIEFEKIQCNRKTLKVALEKYNGFSFDAYNIYRFCTHFKINICFFNYENDHYFVSQEYRPMKDSGGNYEDTLNILLVNHNNKFHAMNIKNVENLTVDRFCNICKAFICKRDAAHGDRTFKKHMKKHEKGLIGTKQIVLDVKPRPYVPHILKNKAYWYSLAHNVEYKPMRSYITYDFETVQVKLDKKITDQTTVNANLIPMSVASCVRTSNGTKSKYFDIRTQNWLENWLMYLYESAEEIYKDNFNENIPAEYQQFKDKFTKDAKPNYIVSILGYNSSRFDINLILDILSKIKITSCHFDLWMQ